MADKQPVYLLNFVHCNEFWKTWEVICNLPVSFFPLWNFDGLYWCREREQSWGKFKKKQPPDALFNPPARIQHQASLSYQVKKKQGLQTKVVMIGAGGRGED